MDRDILLFEKMNEIYDKKISFMIESLDNQLKINMLESQYKVVTENGTKEDFEYLYMEAKEETKEKKKGIFNSIVEWVIKIKNRLVDFFREKKIEKQIDKLPDKFEIDEGYDKQFKGFKKFHEWLVKPINLIKQKKYKELTADLIKKGMQINSMVGVVIMCDNTIQMTKPGLKQCANWILKIFKTDCDEIIKMSKINEDDSFPIKTLKEIISMINKVVKSALNWCILVPSKSIYNAEVKIVSKPLEKISKLTSNDTINNVDDDDDDDNGFDYVIDDDGIGYIIDIKTGKKYRYRNN